jgi:hypothetical protein
MNLLIYTKDITNNTGMKERTACTILTQIRHRNNKKPGDIITMSRKWTVGSVKDYVTASGMTGRNLNAEGNTRCIRVWITDMLIREAEPRWADG